MEHSRRLMLVHAHPDDEAIPTGATIARYAAEGARVCLVTCTRGERGEIVEPERDRLGALTPEKLAIHRETELADAVELLGIARHEWLGGAGRWWDSGMVGTPENEDPRAFARADPAEATWEMVRLLREERPEVVVTYDENGGYGHPDHIQAHRVTMAALEPAADPDYAPELGEPWRVGKTYWAVIPREAVLRMVEEFDFPISDDMPGVPDEVITARVDGRDHRETKVAALRAHRSQVDLVNGFFRFIVERPEFGFEHFQLVRGQRGPAGANEQGWEDDLFAGLAPTRA